MTLCRYCCLKHARDKAFITSAFIFKVMLLSSCRNAAQTSEIHLHKHIVQHVKHTTVGLTSEKQPKIEKQKNIKNLILNVNNNLSCFFYLTLWKKLRQLFSSVFYFESVHQRFKKWFRIFFFNPLILRKSDKTMDSNWIRRLFKNVFIFQM